MQRSAPPRSLGTVADSITVGLDSRLLKSCVRASLYLLDRLLIKTISRSTTPAPANHQSAIPLPSHPPIHPSWFIMKNLPLRRCYLCEPIDLSSMFFMPGMELIPFISFMSFIIGHCAMESSPNCMCPIMCAIISSSIFALR